MKIITDTEITSYLDLFETNCFAKPEDPAVKFNEQLLNFRSLSNRVNQLANYLLKIGVEKGMLVGVSSLRSIEMIISMLAIHKVGAAYVPLDPDYPADRINYMIKDSGLKLVLSNQDKEFSLPNQVVKTINISALTSEIKKESTVTPSIEFNSEDLAYVIYTSGSTGFPKGVMITHSNLLNFVNLVPKVLNLLKDDIYLQTASITYALSVRQIFVPLSHGVKLVIANPSAVQDPIELFKLIKKEEITLVDFVPSHWRSCNVALKEMNEISRNELLNNKLRRIVTVGETLLPDLPLDWINNFNQEAEIVNIFGQTETTGIITNFKITKENINSSSAVPIGETIPETKVYILNPDNLSPVEKGQIGELCVSNPCVGKGYLNNSELTETKFLNKKFDDCIYPLYRTGDLARIKNEGSIEYLGRSDFQVKVRGMRVELGEIESVILRKGEVKNAVVVPQARNTQGAFLVAFITLHENKNLEAGTLKGFMKENLPPHMIPVSYVFLNELPRNPNGKIDRKKLTEYTIADEERSLSENKTLTQTENILVSIWKKLLSIKRIETIDNFFDDLGGDSLLAVHIFLEIEKAFGKRLAISNLYRAPTIESLAQIIDDDTDEREFHSLISIKREGTDNPLFLIHGAEGNILFLRDLSKHLPDDLPVYGLQSYGLEGKIPLLSTIEEMAEAYLREIKMIQPTGPYKLCGYCMGGTIAMQIAQQLKATGDEVKFLGMLETYNWSQLSPRSVYDKAKFALEKDLFIVRNLLSLPTKKRTDFFITKYNNFKNKIRTLFSKIKMLFDKNGISQNDLVITQSDIKKHNDAAAFIYKAKYYDGKLTVFLPEHRYSVHSGENAIWDTENAKEVDSIVLPFYPTGMLVEPFVKQLAEHIKKRIK